MRDVILRIFLGIFRFCCFIIRFPFYIYCCRSQGACAFIRIAGLVVGGACINNYSLF